MPKGTTALVHEHKEAVQAAPTAEPQRGKNELQTSFPMPILTRIPADVKILKEFQRRNIPNIDIIDTMRTAWPGFDKSLLSKCRNYKHYGVGLRREAVKLLSEHFHLEAPEAKRQPRRTKPKRIQLRLTEEMYASLQRLLADRGQTAQEYLEAIIVADLQAYAKEMKK